MVSFLVKAIKLTLVDIFAPVDHSDVVPVVCTWLGHARSQFYAAQRLLLSIQVCSRLTLPLLLGAGFKRKSALAQLGDMWETLFPGGSGHSFRGYGAASLIHC